MARLDQGDDRREQFDLNWESTEDRDVLEILRAWERARQRRAQAEFAAIGRAGQDRIFLQAGGLGGYLDSQVHAESFHYWGQKLGYDCWNDPQFVKEYLRDNDYARVKSKPRNPTISFAGADIPARGDSRPTKRVNFGRGTMEWAPAKATTTTNQN